MNLAGKKPGALDAIADKPQVRSLEELFTTAGHSLYLVGGTVRDALRGQSHEDLDFATDAAPKEISKLVKGWADEMWLVGIKFGTVAMSKDGLTIEITTFREEVYKPRSRHPEVSYTGDIYSDLKRRDFTMNAIALKLPERELVDPFGGRADLEKNVLKTPAAPKDSFADDPLRMLRAVRFVATLGSRLAPNVKGAIRRYHEALSFVSQERIRDEFSKIMTAPDPVPALRLMMETGLVDQVAPELRQLDMTQDPDYRHKDVLEHTFVVVSVLPPELELRLTGILHDVGKPATRRIQEGKVTFYGHDVLGARMAKKRLRELRYPNEVVSVVVDLIRMHMRAYTYRMGWTDKAVRKFVRDAGPLLPRLVALIRADSTTRRPEKMERAIELLESMEERITYLEELEESAKIRPALNGHEVMAFLGIGPGPVVGEALGDLLEARLDGAVATREEGYEHLERWAQERSLPVTGVRLPPPEEQEEPETPA